MIEIVHLSKSFGDLLVLKNVSLNIQKGQSVSIIGPSGSGKSTLLRCINLIETPELGHIIIDGISSKKKSEFQQVVHRNVGMVFQSFNLFPHKNVIENLTLAPHLIKKNALKDLENQAMELLERVGLTEKKLAYPQMLSGGQKQRVAIARALMMKPQVMLFDEPTSSLDPEMVCEVLDVMRELHKEGMTMIIVSHEMSFVRECSENVVFMDQGEIVEQSHPRTLFESPVQERTQNFLSKVL
ncbi:MAG: amino acid ABC transporter ATP-binding protein [Spirochaetia bacterium]